MLIKKRFYSLSGGTCHVGETERKTREREQNKSTPFSLLSSLFSLGSLLCSRYLSVEAISDQRPNRAAHIPNRDRSHIEATAHISNRDRSHIESRPKPWTSVNIDLSPDLNEQLIRPISLPIRLSTRYLSFLCLRLSIWLYVTLIFF